MARQGIVLDLIGGKALAKRFKEVGGFLGERNANNANRRAMKKAVAPVADMAKSIAAAHGEGELADSIQVGTKLTKRQKRRSYPKMTAAGWDKVGWIQRVFVGPTIPDGSHGVLVEFGTSERTQKTTGKSTGAARAFPFMRPAWDSQRRKVLKDYQVELWKELEKAVKRARRKQEGALKAKAK